MVRTWDVATGRELLAMRHGGEIRARFLPDGRVLAWSNDLALWNGDTGAKIWSQGFKGTVTGVVPLPGGRRVATSGWDQTLRVIDVDTGRGVVLLYGAPRRYLTLDVTRDGEIVAAADEDGVLRIGSLARNSDRAPMRGHWGGVRHIAVSADGRRVLSSGNDGSVRLWDVASGLAMGVYHGHAAAVWDCAMTRDGATAISGAADGTACLWDLASGRQTRRFGPGLGMVTSVGLSPDGRRLTVGGQSGQAKVFDRETGRDLLTLQVADVDRKETKWVGGVDWSPDGRRIVTCCADGRVRFWDAESGRLEGEIPSGGEMVVTARWSPDGRTIAAGLTNLRAALYDAGTRETLHVLEGHPAWVMDAAFTPDGTRLLTGDSIGTVCLWDTGSGRELHRFAPAEGIAGLAFLPGNRTALLASVSGIIERLDLDAPARYREFDSRLAAARAALDRAADDPEALRTLGEWYAWRGVWNWAAKCLERARAGGAAVSPEILAPCLWRVQRWDDADREYERLAEEREKTDPQAVLHAAICRSALRAARAAAERHARLLEVARPLRAGRSEESLDRNSRVDAAGYHLNVYSFLGYAGDTIEIRMQADGFAPRITLNPPVSSGIRAEASPRDPAAVLDVTLPDDGAYALICTSKEAGGAGSFTLEYKTK